MTFHLTLFIIYKVERGKLSFQCGTKRIQAKARQGKTIKPKKPKPKILEYLQYIYIYIYIYNVHTLLMVRSVTNEITENIYIKSISHYLYRVVVYNFTYPKKWNI